MAYPSHNSPTILEDLHILEQHTEVGDLVFIQVPLVLFRKVAEATCSWTNHVGVVISKSNGVPVLAESRFPFSTTTSLARFVGRSGHGRVALARPTTPLDEVQRASLAAAARKRMGIFYDTGFDLHSRRQFCSRFVREVMAEATGHWLGEVTNFADLLAANPRADQRFWQLWYFGRIPWQRKTVAPASLLGDQQLAVIFDGHAANFPDRKGVAQ